MNNTRKPNAMLIELVIVILFFAISASIILQLFVAANDKSVQNISGNAATFYAEDIAERFAASHAEVDAFFAELGWEKADGVYQHMNKDSGRTLRLVAEPAREETDAGVLDSLALTIYDGERGAFSMPVARYLPREDAK